MIGNGRLICAILIFIILELFLIRCKTHKDKIYNGLYCVLVTYYNSNTETKSSYTLTAEIENNEVNKINFPQGWLDNEHYKCKLSKDVYGEFKSDRGYDFTIKIIEEGDGCLSRVPKAIRCIGKTLSGRRCKRLTDNENRLCWQHQYQAQ